MSKNVNQQNKLTLRSFTGVGVLKKTKGGGAKLRTPLRVNYFVDLHFSTFLLLYSSFVL